MKRIIILIALPISLCSCFQNYLKYSSTQEWDYEKMKDLCGSEMKFLVYYTNNLKTLSINELEPNHLSGKVERYEVVTANAIAATQPKDGDAILSSGSQPVRSEVHIFISEEFRDQKTVMIDKNNFLEMRVYKLNTYSGTMIYIGLTAGILLLIISILGARTYNAYLRETISLNL